MSLRVAVIGAGVSGLISARELQKEGHQVVILEKSDKIGGLWMYDPKVETDSLSLNPKREIVHSSMYINLRTNIPRHLMSFSDFAFTEKEYGDPRLFPGHQEVLSFLRDFADHFGLVQLIRFSTEVVQVEVHEDRNGGTDSKWMVKTRKLSAGTEFMEEEEEIFDAVMVCSGNHTEPRVAHFTGIDKWPGEQLHSHNYRVPEPFKDKVVVVIGNGPSGFDISRDVSRVAKEVHISARAPNVTFSKLEAYTNIWQHSGIDYVTEDGKVIFKDASFVHAHVILHCTGYEYRYPYLKTNGIVSTDNKRVGPLYKHVFPPELAPRLSFIGLTVRTAVFETAELQSRWVARVLSGKASLPSKEEMMADVKDFYQKMEELKRPRHYTHTFFGPDEIRCYLNFLSSESGEPPVQEWKIELFKNLLMKHQKQQDGFRDETDIIENLTFY